MSFISEVHLWSSHSCPYSIY